jgi:hypothetical protein
MMQFNDVTPISKNEAVRAFDSGSTADVCKALVSVALCERDWQWAQDRCLELLDRSEPAVRGLAATCLGHVARIHRTIDKVKVLSVLESLVADPDIGGRVEDAIDDINQFA